jgi:glycosyltransferase involved in cell wall biosynthesis
MGSKDVTIIIPCRNEEGFIERCLQSVLEQDFPRERMEVFVLDGMSEDRTRDIIRGFAAREPWVQMYDNPKKTIPSAMNIGIKKSSAPVIMKMDAHTAYERKYVSTCLAYLTTSGADNVGGLVVPVPRRGSLVGEAIAASLSSVFGIGNAGHRLSPKAPRWSDTAYSGCYRKEVFERVGPYDEQIERSEDVAMNSKIRRAGGKILLVPEIRSRYFARSTFREFIRHNFDNGYWVTFPLGFGVRLFSFRHIVPFLFVMGLAGATASWTLSGMGKGIPYGLRWDGLFLLGLGGSYVAANLVASMQVALNRKDWKYVFLMPVTFACLHLSYGLGSAWGLLKAAGVLGRKAFSRTVRR